MAARAGVTKHDVIGVACAAVADGTAVEELRLGALARQLGIRPQSMYAHVDGVAGLQREVTLVALRRLQAAVTEASIGRSGTDAARAIVQTHLDFARAQPGLYHAALRPPDGSEELRHAIAATARPLDLVLATLGLHEIDRIHWTRLFLAGTAGFARLQEAGALTLPVDIDRTAARLVTMLVRELEDYERRAASG